MRHNISTQALGYVAVYFLVRNSSTHSYSGRLAYLRAMASVLKPPPLTALGPAVEAMRDVVLAGGADLPDDEHGQYATELSWASFSRKRSPATTAVVKLLKTWQSRYKIAPADTWLMDAALQTVAFAVLRKRVRPREWVYYPPELVWPIFVPKLRRSRWLGIDVEPWPSFRSRVRVQFAEQLNRYRLTIQSMSVSEEVLWAEQRAATWLARYVGGASWDEMAAELVKSKPLGAPKSTVRNYSIRLAERIGLTLPKRPGGRRPRRSTSST
jgi:hypothetical protein